MEQSLETSLETSLMKCIDGVQSWSNLRLLYINYKDVRLWWLQCKSCHWSCCNSTLDNYFKHTKHCIKNDVHVKRGVAEENANPEIMRTIRLMSTLQDMNDEKQLNFFLPAKVVDHLSAAQSSLYVPPSNISIHRCSHCLKCIEIPIAASSDASKSKLVNNHRRYCHSLAVFSPYSSDVIQVQTGQSSFNIVPTCASYDDEFAQHVVDTQKSQTNDRKRELITDETSKEKKMKPDVTKKEAAVDIFKQLEKVVIPKLSNKEIDWSLAPLI